MKRLSLLLLILLSLGVIAQNESPIPLPDSLAGRLKEHRKTDFARAEALDAAIGYYYHAKQILEAEGYILELSLISKELKDNYFLALSEYYKSLCALERLDYEGFTTNINKALDRVEMLRLTDRTALLASRIYLAKSSYYSKLDMLPECYDAIQKGLGMIGNNRHEVYYMLINNLGDLYLKIGNPQEAEKQFRKASRLKKTLPYRNLASIHFGREDYDSVAIYLDSALQVSTTLGDSLSIKHFYGAMHIGKGELNLADKSYKDCLKDVKRCNELDLNTVIYLNSAYIAMEKGNLQQALSLIDSATFISRKLHNVPRKLNCIRLKAIILSKMQDFEGSLVYLNEYSFIRDSLLDQQNRERVIRLMHQQEITEMQGQFEAEKTIAEQRQKYILIIMTLAIFFTVVITVILIKNRKQKELLLKQELDLRNREITSESIEKIQSNEILHNTIKNLPRWKNAKKETLCPPSFETLRPWLKTMQRKTLTYILCKSIQTSIKNYWMISLDSPKMNYGFVRSSNQTSVSKKLQPLMVFLPKASKPLENVCVKL